jgi:3-deoxy-7-phosphoheptulonate synthase
VEETMIVILKPGTTAAEIKPIYDLAHSRGIITQDIYGKSTKMIGLAGDLEGVLEDNLMCYSCVERIIRVEEPYKLAGRKFHPDDSVISVGDHKIGGGHFGVIAGPCSVESEEQILNIAREVKVSGAGFLRGGAFKPRTSPYAFMGLGLDGLELLKIAREKTGLPIVTELMSEEYLDNFAADVDIIQIGARNMQNFPLLRRIGEINKPILLKRGPSSSIDELLMAAEHLMVAGSAQVILCERGIRTFETATRNTLDLSAVPVLQNKSHLPVVVDPSHGTGYCQVVEPMTLAAVACGADGIIIEVHNKPEAALCDGAQSVTPFVFRKLMQKVWQIRKVLED